MTVYTRRGDSGTTQLQTGEHVSKVHPRIRAYGTVDELNALLGTVRPTGYADVDEHILAVQHELHVLQAELANPASTDDDPRLDAEDVDRMEAVIDRYEEELDPLQHFILPGGSERGARVHHARTVARRAERRMVALADADSITDASLAYINRLSDLLFVLARVVNARDGVVEERPTY